MGVESGECQPELQSRMGVDLTAFLTQGKASYLKSRIQTLLDYQL